MEWLATLFFVLIIVLLVGGLFAAGGARGPWPSMLWFFLLLFVGTLAMGVWVEPVGPQPWGAPILTFLVAAILIALLVAAATPREARAYRRTKELPLERDTTPPHGVESGPNVPPEEESETVAAAAAVGVFFWVFLIVAGTILLMRLLFTMA